VKEKKMAKPAGQPIIEREQQKEEAETDTLPYTVI
jgi:hypothetical protein